MLEPTFSFLLPAYKKRYFKEALESIMKQTYPNFQVYVSDDASPEYLEETVSSFHDGRLHFQRNEKNMGAERLVTHWNNLLAQCESDYAIVASDDDIYDSHFLEEIVKQICIHPNADLLRSAVKLIDSAGEASRAEQLEEEMLDTSRFIQHLLDPSSILCIGNYVFRTQTLKARGGFVDFLLGWKSDTATQLMLSQNGIACIPDALFSFRMSGLNISSHSKADREKDCKKLKALIAFHKWLLNNLDSESLNIWDSQIKHRLEGESRMYYWTLNCPDFLHLYKQFKTENWFGSVRNKLSFLWGWLLTRISLSR